MKAMEIEESKLHFDEFSCEIIEFLKTQVSEEVHPSSGILIVDEQGRAQQGPDEGHSNFLEVWKAGFQLFFPFSCPDCGEPNECADGKVREVSEESDFGFDCVGFLVKVENGRFIINSAVNRGGMCMPPTPPSVVISDCDVFDEPMEVFIRSFISTR